MSLPPVCACGIYASIPHEHAAGLPKTGAPLLGLSEFGPDAATARQEVEKYMIQGLIAKVGEDLFKVTERGHLHFQEVERKALARANAESSPADAIAAEVVP